MSTKYPIILVHGIMIKDFKKFKAFGKIEKILTLAGYKVYTARIDGLGTIKDNALQLKWQIISILDKEQISKVNLIAHSKGGLDSKYMIEHLDMENKVASLTTLCTPHKGSVIASILLKLPKFLIKLIAWWLNLLYKIAGDKHPNAYQVCKELQQIDNIEDEIMFSSNVYCQSYSSTMEKSQDDFIMGIPLIFSKYFEKKASDGLVSVDSSKFAIYKGNALEESISHTEIVDFMVKKKKKEKIYHFYNQLCQELIEMGF